jgi:secretion/DNA translocation related TadE-like protein
VLVLAVSCVVMAAGVVATMAGTAVLLRHRAAVAADAAALAAATRVGTGPTSACSTAGGVARADGASLTSCTLVGSVAEVTVAVHPPEWLAWLPDARLNARAGPAATYGEEPAPLARPS